MNALKTMSLIGCAVFALGLGAAQAADESAPAPAAEVSRAEVLADLVIWRESGMANLHSGESVSDPVRPDVLAAMERYAGLRASPQFAALVQRIARERGVKVDIAAKP